jgi:D-inositol-3-phosphate glycosyltransferase
MAITNPMQAQADDARPSDRAGPQGQADRPRGGHGPRRVAVLSVHTSPLAQPGTGDSGGMNVYLSSVAERMAAEGVEVDVYTRATGADLPPTVVTSGGVRVHHLQAGPPSSRKQDLTNHLCAFAFALHAHPRFRLADIVHAHYWLSGWVARRLARRRALPFVQSFHTLAREKNAALTMGEAPETVLRVTAEERIAGSADAVIAPTGYEGTVLRQAYRARPSAVRIIPPGVDLGVFGPQGDRHADRQTLGGGRLLLYVGRLQPLKAPDVAVRTLAALDDLLPDDGIPTRLLVCGGASGNGVGRSDVPYLQRLAADLGVADRVAFLAPRPQAELAALYRAADLVLMPSRSESFGLVALEAQASGTPVVATDVGGLRQAVTGGGALVSGHDPRDHASAALPFLVDATVRAEASTAGMRHAHEYSWDRTAQATLELYTELLERRDRDSVSSSDDPRDAYGA